MPNHLNPFLAKRILLYWITPYAFQSLKTNLPLQHRKDAEWRNYNKSKFQRFFFTLSHSFDMFIRWLTSREFWNRENLFAFFFSLCKCLLFICPLLKITCLERNWHLMTQTKWKKWIKIEIQWGSSSIKVTEIRVSWHFQCWRSCYNCKMLFEIALWHFVENIVFDGSEKCFN